MKHQCIAWLWARARWTRRLSGPVDISVVRILLLCAMVASARAQPPVEATSSFRPDLLLDLPYSAQLELDLSSMPGWPAGPPSAVLTSDYRLRMLEERWRLRSRYGVIPSDQAPLRSSLLHQTQIANHPRLNFVQELHFPGGRPLAGLQFERRDFLLKGDRLGIRSISDLQAIARGAGMFGTQAQSDMLSLLGWRSHSQLEWQLGEPTHELQWRFSAGVDRRATSQKSAINLQLVRRF
jgi:hypothetical protein